MIDLNEVAAWGASGKLSIRLGVCLRGVRQSDALEVILRVIHSDDCLENFFRITHPTYRYRGHSQPLLSLLPILK
jgi:hypothetical protein